MTRSPLYLDGILNAPWCPGTPTLAKAYVPTFSDVLDFDSYRLMGHVPKVPAHVTYPDHYALVLAIVNVITQEAGDSLDEILINSRMPSVVRMPQELFGRNVLFLNTPWGEAERIAQTGTRVMVIEERFLRHSVEDADNSLKLGWFNAPQGGEAALRRMAGKLAPFGIRTTQQVAA